jgi:uncharacterized membrane protein
MRKLKKFYNKNKMMVWIVVGIIAVVAVFVLGGYTFSVFGGWSRKPF